MESMEIKSPVLAKKLDGYRSKNEDFLAESELTVTITLHEYRELVSSVATREAAISEAEEDKYKRLREIEALEAEVRELKHTLAKAAIDKIEIVEEGE